MTEPRLKAGIIVQAAIRQAGARGIPATVVRHGDDDAGQVFVVVNRGRDIGFVLLAPTRDYDSGKMVWRRPWASIHCRNTRSTPISRRNAASTRTSGSWRSNPGTAGTRSTRRKGHPGSPS